MKHVASRLVRYANENKVIHSDSILDVALRHLATDKKINHKIRSALHDIDPQLELLVPRQVDDHELQFKRSLQSEFGLVINLSDLKKNHPSRYRKLQTFGSPAATLRRWGLGYSYDRNIEVSQFKNLLGGLFSGQQNVRELYNRDRKLYMAISHQAKKENLTLQEFVQRLGFTYE